jgi:ABC-2 type transport system ATP-binding protein
MSAVVVEHVSYGVRRHFWSRRAPILDDVSFTVEQGELFGFLGPNGAGKTTTMKVILGLLVPDQGRTLIFGEDARRHHVRRRIGFMPERAYFPEHLSGRELVIQHAVLAGMSWQDARRASGPILEQVGLGGARDQRLGSYSKGMLQRAGLAQALVGKPELVVLDEPMSGLDPLGRRDVREIMISLKARGCTVFFSTHILPDVETICDRLAILGGGAVKRIGPLERVLAGAKPSIEVVAEGVTSEAFAAVRALSAAARERGPARVFEVDSTDQANIVVDELRRRGAVITSLQTHRGSLEDVFVNAALENAS